MVKVAFLRWRGREDLHLDLGLARERVDQRDSQRRAMIALERVAVNRPDVAYSRDYVSGRDDGNAGRGDLLAGQKEVLGAVGLTVKNCRFENVGAAVWTEYAGSSNFYIADNLILGRDDRFRLISWGGRARSPNSPSWPEPLYK